VDQFPGLLGRGLLHRFRGEPEPHIGLVGDRNLVAGLRLTALVWTRHVAGVPFIHTPALPGVQA
jgi:hypothetical protein